MKHHPMRMTSPSPPPHGTQADWSWRWKEQWIPHSAWLLLALAASQRSVFSTEGNKGNEDRGCFVAFVSFCSNPAFIP